MKELSKVLIGGLELEVVDRKVRDLLENLSVLRIVDTLPDTGDLKVVYNTAKEGLGEVVGCDDAARVILGPDYRIPTRAEFLELTNTDNCEWKWYYTFDAENPFNSTAGYKVTSKITGNYIFLPAAGWKIIDTLKYGNQDGEYLASSLTTLSVDNAQTLSFNNSLFSGTGSHSRMDGLPIRAVSTKLTDKTVDMGLSVYWTTSNLGATESYEFGDYFAWGETEPKDEFRASNYFDSLDDDNYIKYNEKGMSLDLGHVDSGEVPGFYIYNEETSEWEFMQLGLTEEEVLELIDEALVANGSFMKVFSDLSEATNTNDVVYIKADKSKVIETDDAVRATLGPDWRMPSLIYAQSLINNAYIEYCADYRGSGVSGTIVYVPKLQADAGLQALDESERIAGYDPEVDEHLFFINSGFCYEGVPPSDPDVEETAYWTASAPRGDDAYTLYFSADGAQTYEWSKYFGLCIRPMYIGEHPEQEDVVDFGQGIQWARCNLGATSPTETGNYYSWGELTPKDDFTMDNYDGPVYGTYKEANNVLKLGTTIIGRGRVYENKNNSWVELKFGNTVYSEYSESNKELKITWQ